MFYYAVALCYKRTRTWLQNLRLLSLVDLLGKPQAKFSIGEMPELPGKGPWVRRKPSLVLVKGQVRSEALRFITCFLTSHSPRSLPWRYPQTWTSDSACMAHMVSCQCSNSRSCQQWWDSWCILVSSHLPTFAMCVHFIRRIGSHVTQRASPGMVKLEKAADIHANTSGLALRTFFVGCRASIPA